MADTTLEMTNRTEITFVSQSETSMHNATVATVS